MNLKVTYYTGPPQPKTSAFAQHGQDWDEWRKMKPSYAERGHQLGWDPDHHDTGKGFILEDGSVWTWPTKDMRPQHMEYSMKAKRLETRPVPQTAFHIDPTGKVWFFGEGRKFTPEQAQMVQNADPRLTVPVSPEKEKENEYLDPALWEGFNGNPEDMSLG